MTMTRKDFVAIAIIVARIDDYDTRLAIAVEFASWMRSLNPRFDRSRFYAACNVG